MTFLGGKPIGIIYLDKARFDLYDGGRKAIFRFTFKSEVARDFEIVNKDQLYSQIKSFVESNKLLHSPLIIILSKSTLFEKDFTSIPKEQQEVEVQKFLDNMPFEIISSKILKTEKEYKAVATNGYFIECIKNAFERLGFVVTCVIPSFVLGNIGDGLNQEMAKLTLSRIDSVKQYNLLTNGSQTTTSQKKEEEGVKIDEKINQKNKKKNLIAAGIFVLFIVVLFIIVFIVLSSQNTSLKR